MRENRTKEYDWGVVLGGLIFRLFAVALLGVARALVILVFGAVLGAVGAGAYLTFNLLIRLAGL